jgi:hypothetical protein
MTIVELALLLWVAVTSLFVVIAFVGFIWKVLK